MATQTAPYREVIACAKCSEQLGHRTRAGILPGGARIPVHGVARIRCPRCGHMDRYFALSRVTPRPA